MDMGNEEICNFRRLLTHSLSPSNRILLAYRHQYALDCLIVLINANDSVFHLQVAAALLNYR